MSEETWLDSLPEPLRAAPFIGKAESLDDAVAKLAHAATLVGTSIKIPDEKASDEDRAAFYAKLQSVDGVAQLPLSDDEEGLAALMTKLGKPAESKEYGLPEIADFEWDTTMGDSLRQYAFDAGMTSKQFNVFATKIAEQEKASNGETEIAMTAARKNLRDDWGDSLESREDLIRGWMEHSNAPASLKEQFKDKNLDLDTMNWLYATANQFKGEVSPISKDRSVSDPVMTPHEAQAEISKILGDIVGMRETDPRYAGLQVKLVAAQRLANPTQAA